MIKPKHSFNKGTYDIKEEFIDREEAKNLYRSKLCSNTKEYNVLAFFGVGGIGKSKLRKELCRLHKEENEEAFSFYLDLNAANDRNMGEGILKLVDSCDKKIDFKCFEIAYGLYFRKKHPSAMYGREKGLITDNSFVGIGLDFISIFDNGVTETAAEVVERTIRAVTNRSISKEVKDELKRFDEYSISEMEERLPLFFQYDLMSYLEKHKGTKVLIIFDTFEALNENVIEQVHRNRNEKWVQEIIEYFDSESFPNLLIMIFGRDEIEWGEDWQPIIDHYQLKEFEGDYSKKYLLEVGIKDKDIIDVIARGSRGFPLLLYLSAETYANMKNNGKEPVPSDFYGSYPEIIERFLYNLDKDTVEVLRLMSIPNYYDNEIFDILIKAFNISFPLTEYEQFNKYSFVNYEIKDNAYYVHDIIRASILEKTPIQTQKRAHNLLLDYFSNKVSCDLKTKYVLEMFFHARKSMSIEEFDTWLVSPICNSLSMTPLEGLKAQQARGEQSVLIQIIDGIKSDFNLKDLRIDLVNIYIDIVHLGGDYETAVDICDRYLANYSMDDIYNDQQLLRMRIRKIHHSMFFSPVNSLIKDAESVLSGVIPERYPYEYNELLFLLGGNLGVLSGDFEYASQWLDKSMSFANENGLSQFVHRTLRKQADILLSHDNFEKALKLVNQTIDKDSSITDINSRYKIYLMAVLGEIYRKIGDLEVAWKCYELVDKKCTENYMPGWQAHSYLAKGLVKCQEKAFDESLDYINHSLSIYKKINQKWGIINSKEALLLLQKSKGVPLLRTDVDECRDLSEKMNYLYNLEYAERLITEKSPYLQLFFL